MSEYGEQDHVRIERAGDTVHVTLCNPDARNAQTPATWRRLASVPALLTPDVRAVVLRGEGVSFSAGLDRRMLPPEGVPGRSPCSRWPPTTSGRSMSSSRRPRARSPGGTACRR